MYLPIIPLSIAVKFTIAIHLFGSAALAFLILDRDIPPVPSAAISLLFITPIAVQVGVAHLEKLFAWPWLVLAATQVVPWRLQKDPIRAGTIIGASIGLALLAGGHYYAAYTGLLLLIGVITLGWKAYPYLKRSLGWASIVGLPHIVIVIIVMIGGTNRPRVHYKSTISDILAAVSGLHYTPLATLEWPTQAYAVIGLPAMLVGAYGWYRVNYKSGNFNHRWSLAVAVVGGCSLLLAGGNRLLYLIPGVDTLRVASRVAVLISVILLLLAWYAIRDLSDNENKNKRSSMIYGILVLFLILSASIGGAGLFYHIGGAGSDYPQSGEQVTSTVSELNCESVWIMSTPVLDSTTGIPISSPELGFALAKEGITVRAMHYGSIGQEWKPTTADGTPTFDALLTGGELPEEETIPLSVSDHPDTVGTIPRDVFAEPILVNTTAGTVWIYPVEGECNSSD